MARFDLAIQQENIKKAKKSPVVPISSEATRPNKIYF